MATYKLVYFDARGVVEQTRIMFHIANQKFEDFRYPVCPETWARPEFQAACDRGELFHNLDRAPILYVDNVAIGQSKAIDRFVARRFGFMGSNDIEAALIDAICEHVADIKKTYSDCKLGKSGEELDAAKSNWVSKTLPQWAAKVEKCLGNDGYAVGTALSLADLTIWGLFEMLDDRDSALQACLSLGKVTSSYNNTQKAAADWLAIRPVTKF